MTRQERQIRELQSDLDAVSRKLGLDGYVGLCELLRCAEADHAEAARSRSLREDATRAAPVSYGDMLAVVQHENGSAGKMVRDLWEMYVSECTRHQVTIEQWAHETVAWESALRNLIKKKRGHASDWREGRLACSRGLEEWRAEQLDAQADELEDLLEACHSAREGVDANAEE